MRGYLDFALAFSLLIKFFLTYQKRRGTWNTNYKVECFNFSIKNFSNALPQVSHYLTWR